MQLYNSLSARLTSQHQTIAALISGIDKERLLKRPAPDKWNVHDNITHLAKYQPVFIERINKILSSNRPSFGRYNADDDPEFETWRKLPVNDLVDRIETDRQAIIKLITGLSEEELSRVGIHLKYGNLNILKWTEFFVLHEAHHLFTIFQLINNVD
ncbi:DinB family protein [Mucilaginibacter sp. AW1-3]